MNKIILTLVTMFVWLVSGHAAAKSVSVQSPDGNLKVTIEVSDRIYYSIYAGDDLRRILSQSNQHYSKRFYPHFVR